MSLRSYINRAALEAAGIDGDSIEMIQTLADERQKFTQSNEEQKRIYVELLIARGAYPTTWPPPAPYERMEGWGADWCVWSGTLECPKCKADLRDRTVGPPFTRLIGLSDGDSVRAWRCPDCEHEWPRTWGEP